MPLCPTVSTVGRVLRGRPWLDTAGYPVDEDGRLDIAAIIDGIDFWGIVERRAKANPAN